MVVLLKDNTIPPPPYFAIEHSSLPRSPLSVYSSASHENQLGQSSSLSFKIEPGTVRGRWSPAPSLPSHVLLLITYETLPKPDDLVLDKATGRRRRMDNSEFAVRMTRTLYWMGFCLRAVNRGFYLAAMHILRSTFLPHYVRFIRPPYTTDPFPHTSHESTHVLPDDPSPSQTRGSQPHLRSQTVVLTSASQSESEVLDRFILFQLHEDVFSGDSSLHTARPDTLRDLFDFMQPRARLADLVRMYGERAGLFSSIMDVKPVVREERTEGRMVMIERHATGNSTFARLDSTQYPTEFACSQPSATTLTSKVEYSPSTSNAQENDLPFLPHSRIPHTSFRITFSTRTVGLVYVPHGRTVVQVFRERDEMLESSASQLVKGLKGWLVENSYY